MVGSWVGAGHQKDQARLEAWNFQPIPHPLRKEERLEIKLIINYAHMMKTP